MAEKERLKIGIIFNFDPVWMGGITYIQNLVNSLNYLDDQDKPEVFLFYRSDLEKHLELIDYPLFTSIKWVFPKSLKGYLFSWFKQKNLFVSEILNKYPELDGLFPVMDHPVKATGQTRLVCWYADLQHKYYPEFLPKKKRLERNFRIFHALRNSQHLVVSSKAVKNDFKKFFRLPKKLRVHIYRFVSIHDDLSSLSVNEILNKYHLPPKYFMVSNQFHKHKNHEVVLRALLSLKEKGVDIKVAMSGPFLDAPPTTYRQSLKAFIDKYDLWDNIAFLGVLPRNELLLLMKNAQAVIQPSLFEGWSTVIEDAISLQVPVIASSLAVNIEQLGDKGYYFDPHDDQRLVEIISSFPERKSSDMMYEPYEERVKKAAMTFVGIFKD